MGTLRHAVLLAVLAGVWPVSAQSGFTVGDRVWHDLDADGIQDPGEPGAPGIKVRLRAGSGELWGEVLSGTDGSY